MKYYILTYTFIENYLEKRTPYRKDHFEVAKAAVAAGSLLLGGATEDPGETGVLIFQVKDKSQVETFAAQDPYVKNGIVSSWEIKEWNVVLGSMLEV
ncbi:YciI-like protein [uncultured Dokdonia sp.]|uniref:YciI-like protein n=1 Tax=uncultured Dokdonia sp. TaxID=575653 RepID=UPI00262E012E|nr:YciI-like protein [uncultured Dokdonia sp.]